MSQFVIRIPQPCSESWAAMTPTAAGRHCAACQKTVIDFTAMTDGEVLAHLARAGSGDTCGRLRSSQLERPVLASAGAVSTRWRTWLAAAVAVWGLREATGIAAKAQGAVEQRTADATPPDLSFQHRDNYEGVRPVKATVRGTVRDADDHSALPGISVIIKNSQLGVSTDAQGNFKLEVPAEHVRDGTVTLQFYSIGYVTQERQVTVETPALPAPNVVVELTGSVSGGMMIYYPKLPPAPWHPRRFYYWTHYWLTRPFRSH